MGDFADEDFPDMDYRDRLERNRLLVVQSLDLERHFMFSYLRSNNVFDEEDCELIQNSGTTRQQKNSKFLDVLSTRGESAYNGFVEALEYDLPSLYEAFTGKKAQLKTDSLNYRRKGELQNFDTEFLSRELSKQSEQYNSLTYMHGKLQKEKQLLEKQLIELTGELKSSIRNQEELKFELTLKSTCEKEISQNDQREMNDLLVHCQALVQDNTDKSNIIIALQARLLAINEDRDEMNKSVDELQMKNKNLMQQVKDLTINYDFARTRSIRLQEKYEKSNNELGKITALNRELHQAKFNLSKVQEENEGLHKKLEQYRNVVPALNAKLYLLQEQNEVESEKRSEISEEYLKIRQQARAVEFERDHGNQLNEMLKEKISRLEQSVEGFREQNEFLHKELEQTLSDRDRLLQEREEVQKYNNELLKSRDNAVRNHVDIFKKMERRYSEANKQLESIKKELKDLMIENVRKSSSKEGQIKCEIFESELSNTKKNLSNPSHRQLSKSLTSTSVLAGSSQTGAQVETSSAFPPSSNAPSNPDIVVPEETCPGNSVDKTDVSRQPSVLDQAKAVLAGRPKPVDFTLNNRQLSWVYEGLKGNNTPFQAVLNNPLVFPQFESASSITPPSNNSSDSENSEPSVPPSPAADKRRIGSNRMVRSKRSPSNVAIDSIKAILSPQTNRRKSQPAENLKLYIP